MLYQGTFKYANILFHDSLTVGGSKVEDCIQEFCYQTGLMDGLKLAETVIYERNNDAGILLAAMRERLMTKRTILLSEVLALGLPEQLLELKQ